MIRLLIGFLLTYFSHLFNSLYLFQEHLSLLFSCFCLIHHWSCLTVFFHWLAEIVILLFIPRIVQLLRTFHVFLYHLQLFFMLPQLPLQFRDLILRKLNQRWLLYHRRRAVANYTTSMRIWVVLVLLVCFERAVVLVTLMFALALWCFDA